ncbi:N-acetylmuramoyl-L-alanine amidase [Vagococcus intermedius]|uniref:N-acetylmuramoyl-L-alanine amidase n=1 Tax=Vagococcus intermedius TaxID=2991418 RepID=A0AAF0CUP6_9ENTE|nr:N-acetylmuramoyl-L-alanine amidase [Vagococcus intermedius]WEG73211.1 N-acetylmuramoyl-L-alanine amidase [Vagococcus intermedius]WEG75296.1 N-acetylmuramoyl-L-alanine amidase [Vagococcus intermedius]
MKLTGNKKRLTPWLLAAIVTLVIAFVVTVFLSIHNLNPQKQIIITKKTAQIHTQPKKNSGTVKEVQQGDTLFVLNQKRDWYRVKLSNNKKGWVAISDSNKGQKSPATNLTATIRQDKTKLLLKPKEDSPTITTLKSGTKITISSEQSGWSQVRAGKKEGWISNRSIKMGSRKKIDAPLTNKLYARQNGTYIRAKAKRSSESIYTLTYGDELIYLGTKGDWYKVLSPDKQIGYLPNWTVNFSKPDKKAPYQISPLADKIIILDAGHGGSDVGAISNDGIIYEKMITLSSARFVEKALDKTGANVVMTRSNDTFVDLQEIPLRGELVNADVFISFHYDSSGLSNQATGFTTYYYHEKDIPLGEVINKHLEKNIPLVNRGVALGDFLVIRESNTPSLLLELGYMNNDLDMQQFITKTYQKLVAKSVTDGLTEYFESK